MTMEISQVYAQAEFLKAAILNLEDMLTSQSLMAAPIEGWPCKNEEQRAIARETVEAMLELRTQAAAWLDDWKNQYGAPKAQVAIMTDDQIGREVDFEDRPF